MSENIINQITLDCLINKEIFLKQNAREKNKKINRKDKKFYKKRILNLTRELLNTKKENDNNLEDEKFDAVITPDLLVSFDNFIRICINNFKTIDKNDIIQEDYKDITINNAGNIDINNLEKQMNDDNRLFMRSIKTNSNLDNFVQYKYKKKEEEVILPKLREINLKEPTLRNKGIKKKENIDIVYDENKEK